MSVMVLSTSMVWWLAVGVARADGPPSNNGLPTISGVAQQGQELTADPGQWTGDDPITYSYQWSDGQTGPTITLAAFDVGQSLSVTVTATNDAGQMSATSDPYQAVLPAAPVASTPLPAISGNAQQGQTLSVNNGQWNNNPSGYAYAWEDCDSSGNNCSTITGATSSSYTLQASDVGSSVVAVVTASNAGGANPATSGAYGPVLPLAPFDSTAPGIAGTAQQGDTLIASHGQWNNNPTGYTYVWQDCNSTGSSCTTIAGATSTNYKLTAADVGSYVSVTVTATNAGGSASLTSASVGPVLPPAPANTKAPSITGTPEQGDTLTVANNGTWSNSPTGFTYSWEECSSGNCVPITGATSSSYTLSTADIGFTIVCVVTANGPGGSTPATSNKTGAVVAAPTPPASQPTTTALLASPAAAVTNQGLTLIATVTSLTSGSTALWGTVTFENGGGAIAGCANMPVTPSGPSATVACSTSFAASTAQLTSIFTPTAGSVLKGSASPADSVAVGPDSTATSLQVPSSVNVGSSVTYTASVAPPAARPGPIEPTGSIEFFDGGQPIAACASQPTTEGQATCTVTFTASGGHAISARYTGDANFSGSSSPTESVSAVPAPTSVLGTITSTMQWAFFYTPSYTKVRNLVVNGVSSGATVLVKCHGQGCPFVKRATPLTKHVLCGKKTPGMCLAAGTFLITPGFARHRLGVGSRITIEIVRPSWVGKFYSFTIRSRRGPRIQIGCLAPGGGVPGQGC
jgi:Bacterial Ig-like domain (group 3)